ncbi:hypothetical protein [Nonomuraea insulae]|uniref:ParB-like nuclease family protein n=1 Tax=Nonomuraea insulae TaxID=1616787 RepID=A0ABW1CT28_9ACTN
MVNDLRVDEAQRGACTEVSNHVPGVSPPSGPEIVSVPIAMLLPGESPRLQGQDREHVTRLAEIDRPLLPILDRRVIDGMHRLDAALIRGQRHIDGISPATAGDVRKRMLSDESPRKTRPAPAKVIVGTAVEVGHDGEASVQGEPVSQEPVLILDRLLRDPSPRLKEEGRHRFADAEGFPQEGRGAGARRVLPLPDEVAYHGVAESVRICDIEIHNAPVDWNKAFAAHHEAAPAWLIQEAGYQINYVA